MKEKILISACLVGTNCKYNGKNNLNEDILKLREKYEFVLVCPEQLGGLPTPRVPSEIKKDRVYSKEGLDVTEQFTKGAITTLAIAKKDNIKKAILKEASPSCGVNIIYDGTFSNKVIIGSGMTTRLLIENGIDVYSEKDIDKLL